MSFLYRSLQMELADLPVVGPHAGVADATERQGLDAELQHALVDGHAAAGRPRHEELLKIDQNVLWEFVDFPRLGDL